MTELTSTKIAVDLRVRIGSLEMKNPVMVASGTFGYGAEYARLYDPACLGGSCSRR